MQFDNEGQAILSKVTSDNPKAPPLRIDVVVKGVKYTTGLWPWLRKDGSPVLDKNGNAKYKGKLEVDTYEQQQNANGMMQARTAADPAPAPTGAGSFDDDIPF